MTFEELVNRYHEAQKQGKIKSWNTYRVYYRDGGILYHCFVEAHTAKDAREVAVTEQYIKPETITRVVKDC